MTRRRVATIGFIVALLTMASALVVARVGATVATAPRSSGSRKQGSGGKLDVVGYSTPESVYPESLEPAFEKTPEGSGVSFSNSFGASGDQSRAVAAGQPASIVHFAQAGDMERLVEEGELVAKDWETALQGIAQDSVVVITVRKGNPKGIKSLDDVLRRTSRWSPRTRSAPARRAGTSWPSTGP